MLLYSCKSNHTSAAIPQWRSGTQADDGSQTLRAPEEISTNATQMCFSLHLFTYSTMFSGCSGF